MKKGNMGNIKDIYYTAFLFAIFQFYYQSIILFEYSTNVYRVFFLQKCKFFTCSQNTKIFLPFFILLYFII